MDDANKHGACLTMLFYFTQKLFCRNSENGGLPLGVTPFDAIMNVATKLWPTAPAAEEVPDYCRPVMAWVAAVTQYAAEWVTLLNARKSMSLQDWYRKLYLHSDIWGALKIILLRSEHCLICHRKATVLHHAVYDDEVMQGLDPRFLIPLCHPCHHEIEFVADGRKLSVFESSEKCRVLYEISIDRQPTC